MKKAEIIIIITIVVLVISAVVVGIFAFKGESEKTSSGENEIGNFFSSLFEKKPEKEPEITSMEPENPVDVTVETPEEIYIPEDNEFYEYDDRGNIIKENYGDFYIINQYDENNLRVLSTNYDSKTDKMMSMTEYIYDENKNLIRKNAFDETGAHTSYTEYEYGDDGAHTELCYLPNGMLMDKSYFNKDGYIVKSEYYYKGKIGFLYEFDPQTFCGTMTEYDEDGNKTYYAEFDENGEIVKEKTF